MPGGGMAVGDLQLDPPRNQACIMCAVILFWFVLALPLIQVVAVCLTAGSEGYFQQGIRLVHIRALTNGAEVPGWVMWLLAILGVVTLIISVRGLGWASALLFGRKGTPSTRRAIGLCIGGCLLTFGALPYLDVAVTESVAHGTGRFASFMSPLGRTFGRFSELPLWSGLPRFAYLTVVAWALLVGLDALCDWLFPGLREARQVEAAKDRVDAHVGLLGLTSQEERRRLREDLWHAPLDRPLPLLKGRPTSAALAVLIFVLVWPAVLYGATALACLGPHNGETPLPMIWIGLSPAYAIGAAVTVHLLKRRQQEKRTAVDDRTFARSASGALGLSAKMAVAARRALGRLYGLEPDLIRLDDCRKSLPGRLGALEPGAAEFLMELLHELGKGPDPQAVLDLLGEQAEWQCRNVSDLLRKCDELLGLRLAEMD